MYKELHLEFEGSNGSTTFTDSSDNAQSISPFGNAQISTAQSQVGSASGLFDGTGDYLKLSDSVIPATGDFVIQCYIRLTAVNERHDILGIGQTSDENRCFFYVNSDNTFRFFIGNTGGSFQLISSATASINTWYKFAVERVGNTFKLVVDGVTEDTDTSSYSILQDDAQAYIGRRHDSAAADYMQGYIDELTISIPTSTGLSSEIISLSPDAYWKLDEDGGITARDSSGNANHGTYNGSPSLATRSFIGDGVSYADFDGTDDYVSCPAVITDSNTTPYSIVSFIEVDLSGTRPIFIVNGPSTDMLVDLSIINTNVARIGKFPPTFQNLSGTTTINTSTTYMIACTEDGAGNRKIYVNGVLENSETSAEQYSGGSAVASHIGHNPGNGSRLDGAIAHVAVWNDTALTETQIADIYEAYAGIPTDSPLSTKIKSLSPEAYWKLDESVGTTALDSSGNNNHGTYNGSPSLATRDIMGDGISYADFDNIDDYVDCPAIITDSNTTPYTIVAFVKRDANAADDVLIYQNTDGGGNTYYSAALGSRPTNVAVASKYDGTTYALDGTTALDIISTYMLAVTEDGAGNRKIYVNGVEESSQSSTPQPSTGTATNFRIGTLAWAGYYHDGAIAHVAVWNDTALTETQILDIYNATSVSSSGKASAISGTGSTAAVPTAIGVNIYIMSADKLSFGTWSLQQSITATGASTSFGSSLSLSNSGDILAVGDPSYSNSGTVQGGVFLFRRSGTTWTADSVILASDGASGDEFGCSVDIDPSGVELVVGAKGSTNGKAYLIKTTDLSELILTASDAASGDALGTNVMVSDGALRVVATSPNATVSANSNAGKSYVFIKNNVGNLLQPTPTVSGTATVTAPDKYMQVVQPTPTISGSASVSAGTGATTIYLSTHDWTTSAASTPSKNHFIPVVTNPGNVSRSVNFGDFGVIKSSVGAITIDNHDGAYDYLLSKGLEGNQVRVRRGKKKASYPTSFDLIYTATITSVSFTSTTITLTLEDNLRFLEESVLRETFSGTGGSEGSSDWAGISKQRVFGARDFCPVQPIDDIKLVYYVGKGCNDKETLPTEDMVVYEGGISIPREADYTSLSQVNAVDGQVSTGKCRVYQGSEGTWIRLGSSPDYEIRVSIPEVDPNVGAYSTWVWNELVKEVVSSSNITTGAVFPVGDQVVQDDSVTYGQVVGEMAKGHSLLLWQNSSGVISGGIVVDPTTWLGTWPSEYDFDQSVIESVTLRQVVPSHKVEVFNGKAFPTDSIAPAASATNREALSKTGFLYSTSQDDSAIKNKFPLSKVKQVYSDTSTWASERSVVSQRYFDIFSTERILVEVVVSAGKFDSNINVLDLTSKVTLTWPRYSLSSGKDMVVVGIRLDLSTSTYRYTLWG